MGSGREQESSYYTLLGPFLFESDNNNKKKTKHGRTELRKMHELRQPSKVKLTRLQLITATPFSSRPDFREIHSQGLLAGDSDMGKLPTYHKRIQADYRQSTCVKKTFSPNFQARISLAFI